MAGGGVEPAGEGWAVQEGTGFACEFAEHFLRDILSAMGVASDLPQGYGIDQVEVPMDQLGEGGGALVVHIIPQQVSVVLHGCRFTLPSPPVGWIAQDLVRDPMGYRHPSADDPAVRLYL
jgi:hypothetical protein